MTRSFLTAVAMLAAGGLAVPALAQDCALKYDTYEVSVPHTDMENCPKSMDVASAYCRLSVVAEIATIFAFSSETDCLIKAKSYEEGEFKISFD